ncbi:MAG: hypothetical protein KDA59_11935 [Planctomycetales bacterium]|nr:hypothetical protein [Planctomycetales bacterium]
MGQPFKASGGIMSSTTREVGISGGKSKVPVVLQATARHDRVAIETLTDLDGWFDEQLAALVDRFANFITPNSCSRPSQR